MKKKSHLSAPAQDNILLIRMTWKGCKRTRRWKASFPQFFTKYLLAQIRPASRASDDSCSYSSEIRWMHRGNSSTLAFFRPRSKIRIFGSEITEINCLLCCIYSYKFLIVIINNNAVYWWNSISFFVCNSQLIYDILKISYIYWCWKSFYFLKNPEVHWCIKLVLRCDVQSPSTTSQTNLKLIVKVDRNKPCLTIIQFNETRQYKFSIKLSFSSKGQNKEFITTM